MIRLEIQNDSSWKKREAFNKLSIKQSFVPFITAPPAAFVAAGLKFTHHSFKTSKHMKVKTAA